MKSVCCDRDSVRRLNRYEVLEIRCVSGIENFVSERDDFIFNYGILAKCKSADEFVRLSLVISFCLPLLCYCIGSLDITSGQIKDLAVCWNDCFRRIFGFKRYESVKLQQFYCKELPFEYIVELYKWKILTSRVYVSDRFIFFYEYNVLYVVNEFYNKYALPRSSLSSSHMKCAVMDHFNTFCIEHRL